MPASLASLSLNNVILVYITGLYYNHIKTIISGTYTINVSYLVPSITIISDAAMWSITDDSRRHLCL